MQSELCVVVTMDSFSVYFGSLIYLNVTIAGLFHKVAVLNGLTNDVVDLPHPLSIIILLCTFLLSHLYVVACTELTSQTGMCESGGDIREPGWCNG